MVQRYSPLFLRVTASTDIKTVETKSSTNQPACRLTSNQSNQATKHSASQASNQLQCGRREHRETYSNREQPAKVSGPFLGCVHDDLLHLDVELLGQVVVLAHPITLWRTESNNLLYTITIYMICELVSWCFEPRQLLELHQGCHLQDRIKIIMMDISTGALPIKNVNSPKCI